MRRLIGISAAAAAALLAGGGAGARARAQPPASLPAAKRPVAALAPGRNADRPVCKRDAAIGSLVPRRRECHTLAEWDRLQQAAREQGQTMVRSGGGTPPDGS